MERFFVFRGEPLRKNAFSCIFAAFYFDDVCNTKYEVNMSSNNILQESTDKVRIFVEGQIRLGFEAKTVEET